MKDIIQRETLPMSTEAEQLQVKALTAALPVRMKLLAAAGGAPYVDTFEPTLSDSTSSSSAAVTEAAPSGVRSDMPQVWLIHRPGHYEVVYPAEGYKDVDKLDKNVDGI